MEVRWGHVLMIVLCLLVGLALLYAGTAGGLGMTWTVGGGYFVIISIAAGLRVMGHLLRGRAGELLTGRFVSKLIFYAVLGMMALVVVWSLITRGG